jgi:hypothetical protein
MRYRVNRYDAIVYGSLTTILVYIVGFSILHSMPLSAAIPTLLAILTYSVARRMALPGESR